MKKIFLLIAMAGALMIAVSCSDDDEPKRGNGVFTVNTPMINHMYNTITGEVLGLSNFQSMPNFFVTSIRIAKQHIAPNGSFK